MLSIACCVVRGVGATHKASGLTNKIAMIHLMADVFIKLCGGYAKVTRLCQFMQLGVSIVHKRHNNVCMQRKPLDIFLCKGCRSAQRRSIQIAKGPGLCRGYVEASCLGSLGPQLRMQSKPLHVSFYRSCSQGPCAVAHRNRECRARQTLTPGGACDSRRGSRANGHPRGARAKPV